MVLGLAAARHLHEGSPSDPPSDSAQGSTLVPALALDPERTKLSEDGRINPARLSPVMELPAGDPEVTMSLARLVKQDPPCHREAGLISGCQLQTLEVCVNRAQPRGDYRTQLRRSSTTCPAFAPKQGSGPNAISHHYGGVSFELRLA